MGGGVRVDVNEELKFLCKFKKKNFFFFWGGGGVGGRGQGGEGSGWGGQGGCESRIEVFVQIQKKKIFFFGGGGVGGRGQGGEGSGWGGQGGCESRIEVFWKIQKKLNLMFMKHYAPIRCLYIKVAKLRTGVGSTETSYLQNCSVKLFKEHFKVQICKRRLLEKKMK